VAAKQHVTCRRRTRAFGAGTSQYASGRPVRQLTSPPPSRYGSLSQQDGQKYRYHEYYLIEYDAVRDCFVEDRRVTLFHVMLPLSELQAYVPAKLARRGGRGTKK